MPALSRYCCVAIGNGKSDPVDAFNGVGSVGRTNCLIFILFIYLFI